MTVAGAAVSALTIGVRRPTPWVGSAVSIVPKRAYRASLSYRA
ncbi:hypothetical protein LzC2_07050 [Planctomycetes bacterium LzC2]|uniref:Uncharacterized protein n=1 Tax=Alienimonas chondri TaxID=2681879 RepID=A0ABX1VC60_9PLAN|nr:hypothetical protein [Alienimonas chondri]